jgi:glucose-1-phosphate cytidylyltransferase
MLDISANEMKMLKNYSEAWRVILANTGLNTMTGGRVKRVSEYIGNETFMLTYGDGVSDINIKNIVDFHKRHGKKATISAYNIGQRFGALNVDGDGKVLSFREKSNLDGSLVNIGFMVFEPDIFNYIDDDNTVLERIPLERLVKEGEIMMYHHDGFWQCMDTQRDKAKLENLWYSGEAPWKVWVE